MCVAKRTGLGKSRTYQALLNSLAAILGKNPGATQVHCLLPPIRWPHSCKTYFLSIFIDRQPPPAVLGCLWLVARQAGSLKVG
jgi:hypothetical protein